MKLLFLAVLAAPLTFQGPTPAPITPAGAQDKKVAEAKPVYDEAADGHEQIKTALARAQRDEKRVFVQWGANWCGWCKKLDATCKSDKDLSHELLYEYEVVKIDVGQFEKDTGRFGKHADIAEKYGVPKTGIPYVTLLDATGKVIANQDTSAFEIENARHDPALVLAFLKSHEAPPPDAAKRWDAALARAKAENKRVFMHFGAPWCGWCHRLEDWMAKPEIAAILAKDFVDLKIDVDRAKGADALQARFPRSKDQGLPWFAFLDQNGAALTDSMMSVKDNTGFPSKPEELIWFTTMLDKARVNMTPDDVKALSASLEPKK